MEWQKTTFGELPCGAIFMWASAMSLEDLEKFGKQRTISVTVQMKPLTAFPTSVDNLAVYRLVSPASAEREALEKIVRTIKYSTQSMSDRIDEALFIATAALEVKQ